MEAEKEEVEKRDCYDICRDFISARQSMDDAIESMESSRVELEKVQGEIIGILTQHGAIKHSDTIIVLENGVPKILKVKGSMSIKLE